MINKVLIDSDVILDLFLDREPFSDQSEQIFERLAEKRFQGFVTSAAMLNIYYITRKMLGRDAALRCVRQLLETDELDVLPVDKHHIQTGADADMRDFEDAVQAAVANSNGIDMIVTRNLRDFRQSPIPAVKPDELMRRLEMQ